MVFGHHTFIDVSHFCDLRFGLKVLDCISRQHVLYCAVCCRSNIDQVALCCVIFQKISIRLRKEGGRSERGGKEGGKRGMEEGREIQ